MAPVIHHVILSNRFSWNCIRLFLEKRKLFGFILTTVFESVTALTSVAASTVALTQQVQIVYFVYQLALIFLGRWQHKNV